MANSDFKLEEEIKAYASHITYDIRPLRKREQIKAEYISHFEDSVYHYTLQGYDNEKAFQRVCEELGDVEKIKRMLTIVHKRDKISTFLVPLGYIISLLIIFMPRILSNAKLDYILEQWINLFSVITAIALSCIVVFKSYKYVRALFKRGTLIRKLKKICKQKNLSLIYDSKYYLSVFGKSSKNEITIISGEKQINVKMFACLKRKDIYTLTSINSFFTTNNLNPIFVSYTYPSSGLVLRKENERKLYLQRFYKSNNKFIKEETINPEVDTKTGNNLINILCINPISAKIEVVRTNRAEQVFDGDTFKGYTVYSGNGLCSFLKDL